MTRNLVFYIGISGNLVFLLGKLLVVLVNSTKGGDALALTIKSIAIHVWYGCITMANFRTI